jgi:hypothetical protein
MVYWESAHEDREQRFGRNGPVLELFEVGQSSQKVGTVSLLHVALRAATEKSKRGNLLSTDPTGQVARALLLARANPLVKDKNGETALHHAALSGRQDLYDKVKHAATAFTRSSRELENLEATDQGLIGAPRDVLARTIQRMHLAAQRRTSVEYSSGRTLLFAGLMAFRAMLLERKLDAWRRENELTWYDVIKEHLRRHHEGGDHERQPACAPTLSPDPACAGANAGNACRSDAV